MSSFPTILSEGTYPVATSTRETLANLLPEKDRKLLDGVDMKRLRNMLLTYSQGMPSVLRMVRGHIEKNGEKELDTSAVANIWKMFSFLLDQAQPLTQPNTSLHTNKAKDYGFNEMECSRTEKQFLSEMKAMIANHDLQLDEVYAKERETANTLVSLQDEIQLAQTIQQKYEVTKNDIKLSLEAQTVQLDQLIQQVSDLKEISNTERLNCESVSNRVMMKREDISGFILKINHLNKLYKIKSLEISEQTHMIRQLKDHLENLQFQHKQEMNEATRLETKIEHTKELLTSCRSIVAHLPFKLTQEEQVNVKIQEELSNRMHTRQEAICLLEKKEKLWKGVEQDIMKLKIQLNEAKEYKNNKLDSYKVLKEEFEDNKDIYETLLVKMQQINDEKEEYNFMFDQKTDQYNLLKNQKIELDELYSNKTIELTELRHNMKDKKNKLVLLEQDMARMKAEIKVAQGQFRELDRLMKQKLKKRHAVELELKAIQQDLINQVANQKEENRKHENDHQVYINELSELETKCNEQLTSISSIADKIEIIQEDINTADNEFIKQKNKILPKLMNILSTSRSSLANLESKLQSVNELKETMSAEALELSNSVLQKEEQILYFNNLVRDKKQQQIMEQDEYDEQLSDYGKGMNRLLVIKAGLENELVNGPAEHQAEISRLDLKMKPMKKELTMLKTSLERVINQQTTHTKELRNVVEPLKLQIRNVKTSTKSMIEEQKACDKRIMIAKMKITQLEERRKELKELTLTNIRTMDKANKQNDEVSVDADVLQARCEISKKMKDEQETKLSILKNAWNTFNKDNDVDMNDTGCQTDTFRMTNNMSIQTPNWLLYDIHKDHFLAYKASLDCVNEG